MNVTRPQSSLVVVPATEYMVVSQFRAVRGMTKILNRARHECILKPPAVLTDLVGCQEEIPDITRQSH